MKTLAERHGKLIAYESHGTGRPLVCDTGFVSHLDLQWDYPPYRRFFEALARRHRVIRFDLPGIGLGDPTGNVIELDDDVAVLEDLVDGLGLDSVDLFGASQAAAVMVAYAARHPTRVGKLVLYGGYANGAELSERELQTSLLQLIRAHWGLASRRSPTSSSPGVTTRRAGCSRPRPGRPRRQRPRSAAWRNAFARTSARCSARW
jgi:pimeloyl-ACP methyl ester carboxylesterase